KRVGIAQYDDARVVLDDVRAVRAKTTLAPDPSVNRDEVFIEAQLKNGAIVQHHVEHARGSLARPLTDDELMNKVQLLVDPLLGAGVAAKLAAAVGALDAAKNLDALFALCTPTRELNHA
ncbi:MAG TPA: MmgE/PrpD family protein, partial [Paraburkholderia sp.]